MEKQHQELLRQHRNLFCHTVDVQHLYPFLRQPTEVLTPGDVALIDSQLTGVARAEKLLDILLAKGGATFQSLCVGLESAYPRLLTEIFLGARQPPRLGDTTGHGPGRKPDVHHSSRLTAELEEEDRHVVAKLRDDDWQQHHHQHGTARSRRPLSFHEYDLTPNSNVSLLKADLKVVSNDRDVLREELQKVQTKLDGYKHMTMSTDIKPGEKLRDYDWLKSQCDRAMSELQTLKQQHGDAVKKCDQARRDADNHRHNHKMAKDQVEQLLADLHMVKAQYQEVLAENQKLKHQLDDLDKQREQDREEITELRQQNQEVINECGSMDVINKMYEALVSRYERLEQENNELRKCYTDATMSRKVQQGKVELLEEEKSRLRKQVEEVIQERNKLSSDWKAMQQHCTEVTQNAIEDSKRQKAELLRQLQNMKMERDQYKRDIGAHAADSLEKLGRVKGERDAVLQEYRLVMSERDTVHKEIEQTQDKLGDYRKRLDLMDKEKKLLVDQRTSMTQELTASLQERDNALKQLADMKEKYGERGAVDMGHDVLQQIDRLVAERDLERDRQDRVAAVPHMYDPSSKESLDNKETDVLRKEVNRLQAELAAATQEMEGAKKTRDWAFTERDKIVRERESIRTLCDKLRHERDNAVSKLAEAIRDSEELTKQKNDTVKELKELRDKYDTLMEKEARKSQLNSVGHNHSRDSAIDTDLQEWETETLSLEIRGTDLDDLGFDLVGGKDGPQLPNDPSIFICGVQQDSCVYGKLKNNDLVVKVNSVDVSNVERRAAQEALRSAGSTISLVVRRRRLASTRPVHPVHISLGVDRELGVSIEQGYYVSRIVPGSAAAKEGTLAVGDRILHLNGHSLESLAMNDVTRMVQEHSDSVSFNVLKYCPTPQSSLVSSSSASSGHNLTESSPDAPSLSPKSPRSHIWLYCASSPDSNKGTMAKVGGGSGGSRSDSLESPRQSSQTRSDSHEKMNILKKAIHKIRRPHNSMERQDRDMRCKSEHPFLSSTNTDSAEDSVISDLNDIVKNECLKSEGFAKPKEKRRRADKDRANGGTWPKCRPPLDYAGGHVIPRREKERPRLPAFINENPYVANLGTPPTPPERSDSFKHRGASMKHSPQNSSSSHSSHAYSHVSTANMTVSQAQSAKSNQYMSSPCDQQPPGSHTHPQSQGLDLKSSSFDHRGSLNSDYEKTLPVHFPVTSSHGSGSSVSPPEDYTVVSANNKSLATYTKRIPASRPTSAPSKRTRVAAARARQAQKPTSLDIPPYSPRPIPHTGQSITPSQPFSPASNMISSSSSSSSQALSTSPPPPYSSTQTDYRSPPLTSHGFLPSDKPPRGASHAKNQQHNNFSVGGPASAQVLRSPNPVFQVVSSRVISPTSMPHYPVTNQSSSGRYCCASPTGGQPYAAPRSGIHNTSIPEMDCVPYMRSDRFSTPSPSPSQQSGSTSLTTSASEEFPYHKVQARHPQGRQAMTFDPHDCGSATFPHRRPNHSAYPERIRIPSDSRVLSNNSSIGRISQSSFEKVSSERASPVSPFLLSPDFPRLPRGMCNSLPMTVTGSSMCPRPTVGEIRNIHVEKSAEPLGINIKTGQEGGIFVASVSEHSLASKVGIAVGDQILEVCGINMRNARYNEAACVLKQCVGVGSINMLVQFNPQKSTERRSSTSSESTDSSGRETPEPSDLVSIDTITPDGTPKTHTPTITPSHSVKSSDERFVMLKKPYPQDELGVKLTGGNNVGIFVQAVQSNSISSISKGLRCGDQILEFNGIDFRSLTAEQATMEMSKPCENVSILARYNISKYQKIQDQPGDCLYVRAMLDRQAESDGEISFKKDDILLVDDTLYTGKLGLWRVWLVDEEGHKYQCGTVPSKFKLEDEIALKRSSSETGEEELKGSRRGSGSARRSFFKRKRHQRNNSKDSRDFHSFSDASINSDSLAFLADGTISTFERVERLDSQMCRPVLILGPLAEPLINKLTSESPDKYCSPKPDHIKTSISSLEKGQTDGLFVDFKPGPDGHFECITLQSVSDIMDKKRHCMLKVNPTAIEYLHKQRIYPIVIYIKHKSPKQIREVRDTRFLPEKLSNKLAKELFESFQEHESKHKRYFSETIQGGNLALMCCKIKSAIDKEQNKTLWVPSGCL